MRHRPSQGCAGPPPFRATAADATLVDVDGDSPAMVALKHHIRRVAHDGHVTVLIVGESGTGKERVARAVHRVSPRRRGPFVVVNCAALSATLIEDELFGHVRGAFTGAVADRPGPFERANHGTVFLDEVGELPAELQVKLLRALQQRTVQRLGGREETTFDVQVIAATNVNLSEAMAAGRFREDLYYRLKVYELCVPPLRERGTADLRRLVEVILLRLAECRRRPPPALAPALWDRLASHRWPGNVRELENTLERLMVAAGDETLLTCAHLPNDFGRVPTSTLPEGRRASAVTRPVRPLPSLADTMAALGRNAGHLGRTAAELGVSRHQVYRLLKRHAPRAEPLAPALQGWPRRVPRAPGEAIR